MIDRARQAGAPIVTLSAYSTFFSDLMARELSKPANACEFARNQTNPGMVLAHRLHPYAEARSRIAIVTETPAGSAFDSTLSRAWFQLRKIPAG